MLPSTTAVSLSTKLNGVGIHKIDAITPTCTDTSISSSNITKYGTDISIPTCDNVESSGSENIIIKRGVQLNRSRSMPHRVSRPLQKKLSTMDIAQQHIYSDKEIPNPPMMNKIEENQIKIKTHQIINDVSFLKKDASPNSHPKKYCILDLTFAKFNDSNSKSVDSQEITPSIGKLSELTAPSIGKELSEMEWDLTPIENASVTSSGIFIANLSSRIKRSKSFANHQSCANSITESYDRIENKVPSSAQLLARHKNAPKINIEMYSTMTRSIIKSPISPESPKRSPIASSDSTQTQLHIGRISRSNTYNNTHSGHSRATLNCLSLDRNTACSTNSSEQNDMPVVDIGLRTPIALKIKHFFNKVFVRRTKTI